MLNNYLIIPVVRVKIKVKRAPAIPTGAPTILSDEQIQTPPLVLEGTIKILPMPQKQQHIYLIFTACFSLINFLVSNFQSWLFHLIINHLEFLFD